MFATCLKITFKFEAGTAFNLSIYYGIYDLVYSCGVLNHFDRQVTVGLLREQSTCARYVLIQIPTKYTAFSDGGITDVLIYTIKVLKEIVGDAGLIDLTAFGYGGLTISRRYIWLRRLLPRLHWRWLQNQGFAFSIAVLAERSQK